MASATVHGDNKENIPCVTGVVWKITSVASGTVSTTCVLVNMCAVNLLPQRLASFQGSRQLHVACNMKS